jgi:hypothetical protein
MALHYAEFDSTPQTIAYDLMQAVTTSSDWTRVGTPSTIVSTTASAAVAATVISVPSGHGIVVGQTIRIGPEGGATTEYKNVTAVAATTVTFTAQGLVYAQASGTVVGTASMIVRATTTRGAAMIVDFADTAPTLSNLVMAVWRAHDGTMGATSGGTDRSNRWLYWRTNTTSATWTMPIHVTVSASKEHLFISVEGPRPNETGASSATIGSVKNYFFFDDVVPYHAGDTTPVVFAGGMMAAAAGASAANNSHQGNFSRNYANVSSWSVAKLLTLDFPSIASTETIQVTRQTSADGRYYLAPYVCFGDESGLRGRLANFFLAGYNFSDTPEIATPPINQKITYLGQTYKLIAVNKSDGTSATWGQFGSASNVSTTLFYRSPIVAVPCTP